MSEEILMLQSMSVEEEINEVNGQRFSTMSNYHCGGANFSLASNHYCRRKIIDCYCIIVTITLLNYKCDMFIICLRF